jgi:hemolysin III
MAAEDVRQYLLPDGTPRPRLRGWLHLGSVPVALVLGIALVVAAPGAEGTLAALVYAIAVVALFAASATYHRGRWRADVRAWLQRVDHAMIFVLIAGTYTPICVLTLDGALGTGLLLVVWVGAVLGVVLQLVPFAKPRLLEVAVYIGLGWAAVAAMPQLVDELGWGATSLVGLGGLLYTVGAIAYALKRPDPVPHVFGYHEVFHAFTIAAAGAHYAVIAFWVVPGAA